MSLLDIGTLMGRVEISDNIAVATQRISSGLEAISTRFDGVANKILAGSAGAAAAFGAITTSILTLGRRGSEIADVAGSLERLAGGSENARDALEQLELGTRNTVSRFELMKSATQLLGAGVQLNVEQFRLLGDAAYVMQNRGLGPASAQLNVINQALMTGRTRTLAMRLGVVDAGDATKQYAEKLGIAESALTRTQRVEATREAVLRLLSKAVQEAGEQQASFGDLLAQGRTAIVNWFDALAQGIATSPRVLAAMQAVGSAIRDAFGDAQRRAIDLIVAGVERFADWVRRGAPIIVEIAHRVREFWNWLVQLNERFNLTERGAQIATAAFQFLQAALELVVRVSRAATDLWSAMPEKLKDAAATAVVAGAGLTALGYAAAGVASPFMELVRTVDLWVNVIANSTSAIVQLPILLAKLTDSIGLLTVAQQVSTAAAWSMAAAQGFWSTVAFEIGNTIPILTARLWLLEASEKAVAVSSGMLAAAKTWLTTTMVTLGNWTPILTARIWLLDIAAKASALSSVAMAGGMTAARVAAIGLGTALWALHAIPIVALLTALGYALYEVGKATLGFWNAVREGRGLEFLTQKDTDNWVRRLLGLSTGAKEAADSITYLQRAEEQYGLQALKGRESAINDIVAEVSGARLREEVGDLAAALNKLQAVGNPTADVLARIGEKALALRNRGAELSPELSKLADQAQEAANKAAELARQEAQAALAAQEAEQKAAAYAARLREVNERIAEARGALKGLTDEQGKQAEELKELGISAEDIAIKLNTSVAAVRAYLNHVEFLTAAEEKWLQISKQIIAAIDERNQRLLSARNAALAEQIKTLNDFEEANRQAVMSNTELALRQIEIEKQARLEALRITSLATGNTQYYERAVREIEEFYDRQKRIALETADTLELRLRQQGVFTRQEMRQQALSALVMFEQMRVSGKYTAAQLEEAWKDYIEKFNRANEDAIRAWMKQLELLRGIGEGMRELGQAIGGPIGQMVSGIGAVTNAWVEAQLAAKQYAETLGGASAGQKAFGIARGVGQVIAGTSQGNVGQRVASGALSGAQAGAQLGALFPALGVTAATGIGAAAAAVVGLTRALIAAANAGRELVEQFAEQHGGFDNLRKKLDELGPAGERLWIKLTQGTDRGSAKMAKKNIEEVEEALAKFEDAVQRYNLSWTDIEDPTERLRRGSLAGNELVQTFNMLQGAGYGSGTIIRQMSGDINEWLANSLKAGNQIPASMGPILKQLVEMGQLTEANAAALLGLADAGVPSLDEIKQAAERYGLTLDQLGPKVQQLQINEQANQIVKDFETLTRAGVPFEVLMQNIQVESRNAAGEVETATVGMQHAIQQLVTQALTAGFSLPESMRPIIEKMIDAGLLVDDFGEKLVDTSRLNFEVPITERIDDLILAIDNLITGPMTELINQFIRFGDEAVRQSRRAYDAINVVGKAKPKFPTTPDPQEPDVSEPADPQEQAGGGGTAVPKNSSGFYAPTIIQVDGETLAHVNIKYMPGQAKRVGIRS